MPSLVKKILRGYQRIETGRMIAFRSHWGFESQYCNPDGGHEKGASKAKSDGSAATRFVPVPEAADLDMFKEQLSGGRPRRGSGARWKGGFVMERK